MSKLLQSVNIQSRYVIVYANKGENWDAKNKQFIEGSGTEEDQYADYASEWFDLGARAIGGCCQIGPATISKVREKIK